MKRGLCLLLVLLLAVLAVPLAGITVPAETQPLEEAYENARFEAADTQSLQEAVDEAQALDLTGITQKHAQAYQAVLAAGQEVLTLAYATETQIESMTQLLHQMVEYTELYQTTVPEHTYTVSGHMMHATENKTSMGDAALELPMYYSTTPTEAYLQLSLVQLTTASLQGYLGELNYLENAAEDVPDENSTVYAAEVLQYYDTYDAYNDPTLGSDSYMLAKEDSRYPRQVEIPVQAQASVVWLQVYVPIMDSLNPGSVYGYGSGRQYAQLVVDWTSQQEVRNPAVVVKSLQSQLSYAQKTEQKEATDTAFAALTSVIALAQSVHDTLDSPQDAIDAQTALLQSAAWTIQAANAIDVDKGQLTELLAVAESYLDMTDVYTQSSLAVLKSAVEAARAVTIDEDAVQPAVNEQLALLSAAIDQLQEMTAREALTAKVEEAEALAKKTTKYSQESINALLVVISNAKTLLAKESATQTQIDAQTEALTIAIKGLSAITTTTPEPTRTAGDDTLDYENLEDGVYSVYGDMYKTDKKTLSMANNSITHTMKLTVSSGNYTLTMDFNAMKYSGQNGYLGKLYYYADGFSYNSDLSIKGTRKSVKVISTQKDSSNEDIYDSYNEESRELYPDLVELPVVSAVRSDEEGFLPMQVFVPIMESIAAGTGTQSVLLKLDWSTLKQTTNDDDAFATPTVAEEAAFSQTVDGVTVTADAGVIEEGANLVVERITAGSVYEAAKSTLSSVLTSFTLYDISLEKDGTAIQPAGFVKVYIPADSYTQGKAVIYYLDDSSNKTSMSSIWQDGRLLFETKHFSKYAIGDKTLLTGTLTKKGSTTKATAKTAAKASAKRTAAKTADTVRFYMLLTLSVSGIAIAATLRKKKAGGSSDQYRR